ncbi:MAG TPA: peptidylprolyl isomerase [Polyangiales bacterium]
MTQARPVAALVAATLFCLAGCTRKPQEEVSNAAQDTQASAAASELAASKSAATPAQPAAQPADGKETTSDGYQIIHAKTKAGDTAIAMKAPEGWQILQPPSSPDPHAGKFTLQQALKGLSGKGTLVASIVTDLGTLDCDLYEDKTPNTVANFVGLARGLRKFWDGSAREWVGQPYYDGTTFHRVIPGFMIQAGDRSGDGSGRLWYTIPDELHPTLKHDRAGQLCMANRGPNTNEAQFFITEDAAPHLEGSYSIFGQCVPTNLVYRIARVPQSGPPNNRPLTPVVIRHLTISRVQGGAVAQHAAHPEAPVAPAASAPGVVPEGRAIQVSKPR